MPIHDQSYRRYAGRREPHGRSWRVIARASVVDRLRQRRLIAVLLFAWLPFMVHAVRMYIASRLEPALFLAPTAGTFRELLGQQSVFLFFVTIFAGAGLIANDRRANALQMVLSKPLTRVDYIAGKMAALAVFLLAVTWAPAMMLLLLQAMYAGNVTFVRDNLFLVPAITAFSGIQIAVSCCAMLALSSLSNSSRFVATLYAAIIFFAMAVFRVLRRLTGNGAWVFLSPKDSLDVLADAMLRVESPPPISWPVTVLVIAGLIALSIWILDRHVRAVEVVT
jgi:ABC-type transport system involved in multi-copper enzyme maturation permease subunit